MADAHGEDIESDSDSSDFDNDGNSNDVDDNHYQQIARDIFGFVDFLSLGDLSGLLHFDTIFHRHLLAIFLEKNDQFKFCVAVPL